MWTQKLHQDAGKTSSSVLFYWENHLIGWIRTWFSCPDALWKWVFYVFNKQLFINNISAIKMMRNTSCLCYKLLNLPLVFSVNDGTTMLTFASWTQINQEAKAKMYENKANKLQVRKRPSTCESIQSLPTTSFDVKVAYRPILLLSFHRPLSPQLPFKELLQHNDPVSVHRVPHAGQREGNCRLQLMLLMKGQRWRPRWAGTQRKFV